jgi:hypothetical protein
MSRHATIVGVFFLFSLRLLRVYGDFLAFFQAAYGVMS